MGWTFFFWKCSLLSQINLIFNFVFIYFMGFDISILVVLIGEPMNGTWLQFS